MIATKTEKPKKREEAIAHKLADSIEEYDVEVKYREEYEVSHLRITSNKHWEWRSRGLSDLWGHILTLSSCRAMGQSILVLQKNLEAESFQLQGE